MKKQPCPALRIDDLKCNEKIQFVVEVHNNGTRDGSEVVLVYSKPPESIKGAPIKQLVAFKREFIKVGKTVAVKFELDVCKSLSIVDYNAYQLLPSGKSTIVIGGDVVSFPIVVSFKN